MGAVAAATLAEGGHVHGVTPRAFLPKDYASRQLATNEQETLVPSMHARKALMARLSTGFVGLCGGFGTLEEIAEMTTWTQLGIHKKREYLLMMFDPALLTLATCSGRPSQRQRILHATAVFHRGVRLAQMSCLALTDLPDAQGHHLGLHLRTQPPVPRLCQRRGGEPRL